MFHLRILRVWLSVDKQKRKKKEEFDSLVNDFEKKIFTFPWVGKQLGYHIVFRVQTRLNKGDFENP